MLVPTNYYPRPDELLWPDPLEKISKIVSMYKIAFKYNLTLKSNPINSSGEFKLSLVGYYTITRPGKSKYKAVQASFKVSTKLSYLV